jgi:hypothetical protein
MKQIFKKDVPIIVLYDLLDQVCLKTNKYYVIDMNSYKKLLFYNLDERFSEIMLEYYHTSKQFYVTRKMTYNSFINIVRHICKYANIMYTSQLKYNESKYNIVYHIYF